MTDDECTPMPKEARFSALVMVWPRIAAMFLAGYGVGVAHEAGRVTWLAAIAFAAVVIALVVSKIAERRFLRTIEAEIASGRLRPTDVPDSI